MRLDIITVLPNLLESPFNESMIKRAKEKNLVQIHIHNLRKWGINKYGQVDDTQYGGGAGMVLMCEPLSNAIEELQQSVKYDEIIFMTPDGKTFNQQIANRFSLLNNMLIICGHYKGIDDRIREMYITQEISIGDFVLTGGELPTAIMVDSIVRLIPGVLNNETSALTDSFQDNLLAPPIYTKPAVFKGLAVPEVLLSGHQKNIENWRYQKSIEKTKQIRPDLLNK